MGLCRILYLRKKTVSSGISTHMFLLPSILIAFGTSCFRRTSLDSCSSWYLCEFLTVDKVAIFMPAEKHSRPKPLSIEEEKCIRVFYENKLQEVCNNFHFPHKIQVYIIFNGNLKERLLTSYLWQYFFPDQTFEMIYWYAGYSAHLF